MIYIRYMVLLTCFTIIFFGCTPKGTYFVRADDKMDYLLETENGVITGDVNNTRIIDEINRIANEDVKAPEDYGFIILTPTENINGIQYIQMAKNIGSNEYTVEIRIGDNENFNHYQYLSNSKEDVTSIFLDFTNSKKLPDLKRWEDISDQYR